LKKNLDSRQIEISSLGKNEQMSVLNNETGAIQFNGWSRSPKDFLFNKTFIKPSSSKIFSKEFNIFLRYKKWDAFVFTSDQYIIFFAAFDLSYLGGYFIQIADLNNQTDVQLVEYLAYKDKPNITDHCLENCTQVNYQGKGNLKHFHFEKINLNKYKLNVNYDDENNKVQLNVDVHLERDPSSEALTLFTPISEDGTSFYYNIKQNNFIPNGDIRANYHNLGYTIPFQVTYDHGRGVWPLKSGWSWATGNGITTDGKKIGINIGHGFSHNTTSNTTEDSFIIDGKIFRLPPMIYFYQKTGENTGYVAFSGSDRTSQENLTNNDCRFDFFIQRQKTTEKNLVIAKATLDVNFGYFKGVCTDSNKNKYEFKEVYGIYEMIKRSIW